MNTPARPVRRGRPPTPAITNSPPRQTGARSATVTAAHRGRSRRTAPGTTVVATPQSRRTPHPLHLPRQTPTVLPRRPRRHRRRPPAAPSRAKAPQTRYANAPQSASRLGEQRSYERPSSRRRPHCEWEQPVAWIEQRGTRYRVRYRSADGTVGTDSAHPTRAAALIRCKQVDIDQATDTYLDPTRRPDHARRLGRALARHSPRRSRPEGRLRQPPPQPHPAPLRTAPPVPHRPARRQTLRQTPAHQFVRQHRHQHHVAAIHPDA